MQNSGGDCNKTDSNNTTNNSSNLSQPCNSSTPPANNCKKPLTGDLSGNFEVNKYRENFISNLKI